MKHCRVSKANGPHQEEGGCGSSTSSGVLDTDFATLSLKVEYMSSSKAESCSLWGSDMSFLDSWSPALLYFPSLLTWGWMPAFSKTPATKLPASCIALTLLTHLKLVGKLPVIPAKLNLLKGWLADFCASLGQKASLATIIVRIVVFSNLDECSTWWQICTNAVMLADLSRICKSILGRYIAGKRCCYIVQHLSKSWMHTYSMQLSQWAARAMNKI